MKKVLLYFSFLNTILLFSQTKILDYPGTTQVRDMEVVGNELYIALNNSQGEISKLDLNAVTPTLTSVVTNLPVFVNDFVVDGNTIYACSFASNKVIKVDLSMTPAAISDLITGLNLPSAIELNGNDLYIAEYGANKVVKIDVTATTPTTIDVATGFNQPSNMELVNNDLYVADRFNTIHKLDISNPIPITASIAKTGFLFFTTSLAVDSNNIYVGNINSPQIRYSNINNTSSSFTTITPVSNGFPTSIQLFGNDIYYSTEVSLYKINLSTLSTNGFNIESRIKLYPNPASNFIKLNLKNFENMDYIIYNVVGRIVKSGSLRKDDIKISDLKNGIYFLRVNNGSSYKFIKE